MDFAKETEYWQQIKTFRLKYIFLAGKIIRTAKAWLGMPALSADEAFGKIPMSRDL